MDRPCDYCGTVYKAKRSTSKYCTATCRKAANRKSKSKSKRPEPDQPPADVLDLVIVTRNELIAAGALDTIDGRAALVLARRIEYGGALDSGSAIAAMTRELRVSIAAATGGASPLRDRPADPIDELREKRRQRERRRASG